MTASLEVIDALLVQHQLVYYTTGVNQDEFFADPGLCAWFIRAEPTLDKIGPQIGAFFDYNAFRCSQALVLDQIVCTKID